MTKKYYVWFIYDDEEYVIRMKIRGSLQWDKNHHCFMDKDWYVRGIEDIIAMSALDTHWSNDKRLGLCLKLTHDQFVDLRARGVKRWTPKCETIMWD